MREPTKFERAVGRHVRARLGSDTRVVRFGDDSRTDDVFIVSGLDCPTSGVTSYGTAGFSTTPQLNDNREVFVEILGASRSSTSDFDNLVASCVFDCRRNRSPVVYGSVIHGIIDQYAISKTLRHVTFVSPFLWREFEPLNIDQKDVHWLLMLPIADAEATFLTTYGIAALESVFESRQIDIFDPSRTSAV